MEPVLTIHSTQASVEELQEHFVTPPAAETAEPAAQVLSEIQAETVSGARAPSFLP